MRNNNKGFTLFDSILSFSMLLTILFFVLPMINQVKLEQHILSVRSKMIETLYNEIIDILHTTEETIITKPINISNTNATISLSLKDNTWTGCITWNNSKNATESSCLHVKK
ncbi:hypothetical protein HNQ94_002734 [Salirhabdus euzebyi]|uniref:Type II secretion system protein n=1 Tax=Salirhabdus euzebyi TaxID=394506 RepID=A0A841Q6U8_9BACI|nr:hypothetical protein [Salirhabdus euzebyi]MBB6454259.1 hypothetical protein [Salirhabdus euzebyi]